MVAGSTPAGNTSECFRSSADQSIPLLMGGSQVRILPEVPKQIKALTICRVSVMSKPSFYASSSRSSSICFTFDKTSPSSWTGMTVSNSLNLSIASEMRSHIFESNGEFDIE